MKHRVLLLLILCLILTAAVPTAFATETEETAAPTEAERAPDECGEGITWSFEDGVLTITGDGTMDDFEEGAAPWQEHKDEIEEVIIEGDLTYIGAYAFKNYDNLLAVSFGDALYEIGKEAFASCDGLTSVWLPESFKIFGEGSFQSCKGLEEIHCEGKFPSFRQNSMWDTYVTIYYPAQKPWGTEYIQQLEEAFKGRVEFLASDGTDHYEPTEEPTEQATEPEETVPETEIAETEAPTEPPVIMTRPPETEEATEVPSTQPQPEVTEEPVQQETEPTLTPEKTGGIPTGLVIVGAVLLGIGLGFVLFGRKKGKYAR